MNDPTCDQCDLVGQIESLRDTATITEVPPSRHAWPDVAVCPTQDCGRQFFMQRKAGTDEVNNHG